SRDPRLALNIPRVHFYAKLGIGSYFNSPFDATTAHGLWSAAEWHAVIDAIQAIYAEYDAIPIIYGIDTTHGANYVRDAALFPQPLAAASSFNLALARRMGEVEAKDSLWCRKRTQYISRQTAIRESACIILMLEVACLSAFGVSSADRRFRSPGTQRGSSKSRSLSVNGKHVR
ncbi:hypothetical protein As57867_006479, partial [Aphanomyces stellatus]